MKALTAFLIIISLVGCASTSDIPVVTNFNLDRYLGVWYEAARNPHRFEKGLTSVTAEYVKKKNGTIRVINRGYHGGKQTWDRIEGTAKLKSSTSLGWLKVSFFRPFYTSYKIIYLDQDYTQAIVTGPTQRYLWILVRDPNLPANEINSLISTAKELGINTDRLMVIDQSRTIF